MTSPVLLMSVSLDETDELSIRKQAFEFQCPGCGFYTKATIRQARVRDVVICRGCKADIWLDDQMNSCRKAISSVRRQFRRLEREISNLSLTIEI